MPRGGFSDVKVSVASISEFFGKAPVRSKFRADRETSCFQSPMRACFRAGPMSVSLTRKAVASTRTRSPSSATTGIEASTADGKDSSTTRARSGSDTPLRFAICFWWSSTRGPTRSNRHRRSSPSCPRSSETSSVPGAAREPRPVEELLVEARHVEQELSLLRIPEEGLEALVALQVLRALGDRGGFFRRSIRSGRLLLSGCTAGEGNPEQTSEDEAHRPPFNFGAHRTPSYSLSLRERAGVRGQPAPRQTIKARALVFPSP